MTNLNDLPDGLWLHFHSEMWEEECGYNYRINSLYSERCIDGILKYYTDDKVVKTKDCPHCHGTGKRKYRLVGDVEVYITSAGIGNSGYLIDAMMIVENTNAKIVSKARYTGELANKITAAYRDGTLPDAVKAHLTKEEIES